MQAELKETEYVLHNMHITDGAVTTETSEPSAGAHTIINHPDAYIQALQNGSTVNNSCQVQGLVGRVLRGKTDSDFSNLSPDPNRRIIMFLDSSGLQSFLGLSGYQILIKIGYDAKSIADYLQDGVYFKLVVAPAQSKILAATWNNLGVLITEAYPKVAHKVIHHLPILEKHSGPDGYKKIMTTIADTYQAKMTEEELFFGQLWQIRKFLHDVINLNSLYMGDGFTYSQNADGSVVRGVSEYFSVNAPISTLEKAKLADVVVVFDKN